MPIIVWKRFTLWLCEDTTKVFGVPLLENQTTELMSEAIREGMAINGKLQP